VHPFFKFSHQEPAVFGHRGAAGSAPENTLLSFRTALEQGADVIETDVHLCRDGIPVLIHDPTLERTTDGKGEISEQDWPAIRLLDAGFHCQPETTPAYPFRGQGHVIPSLEEAFEAFPAARFNIELKTGGEPLSQRCVELVEAFARGETTLLTAGEDDQMASLRHAVSARRSRVALGACTAEAARFARAANAGGPVPAGVMALQVPAHFGGRPLVTPAFVDFAHRHGAAVHAWTIDEPDEMEELLCLGVDGIITNYPDRMRAVLASRTGVTR